MPAKSFRRVTRVFNASYVNWLLAFSASATPAIRLSTAAPAIRSAHRTVVSDELRMTRSGELIS